MAKRYPLPAEPVWEIAELYPNQGQWHEQEYLSLETNRLVEYDDGFVEVLPVPTDKHQAILAFLFLALQTYVGKYGGIVRFAALRLRLWNRKYREPDLMYVLPDHHHYRGNRYWDGADLVVEIVSGGAEDRERDLVIKRSEYAQAGIPEYWIVDPETATIIVLQLDGNNYIEHGVFGRGEIATSVLLEEFTISVDAVLEAD
ncbi:MAG: Uma2 family endonuclease [Caldilineaceae bacterium]|nr:Uma2 family endonuclease [Caldilineaceae bacterium]